MLSEHWNTQSASALRIMLATCNDYSVSFNARNSKCLVVLSGNHRFQYNSLNNCPFYVANKLIIQLNMSIHLLTLVTL